MPTADELVWELRDALEAEKAPRAALAAARRQFNAARRDLRAARTAEQRLTAALRALDAAGVEASLALVSPPRRAAGQPD